MDSIQIQFSQEKTNLDLHQLQALFNLAAFWAQNRQIEDLKVAINNSNAVVSVWDHTKLIGFARGTSDGIYRGTIWDVIIHPDYRSLGLGSKLVETVLAHPSFQGVERVYLMTTHKQKFYQHMGFEEDQTTTMVLFKDSQGQNIIREAYTAIV